MRISFTAPFRSYVLLPCLIIGTLLFSGSALFVSHASADSTPTDPVQQHCVDILDPYKKAQPACRGTDNKNVQYARNAGSYQCDEGQQSVQKDEAADCVVKAANKYLDQALVVAKKKSKNFSADDFSKALVKYFEDHNIEYKKGIPVGSKQDNTQKNGCTNGGCADPAADPNLNCDKQGCDFINKYINPAINLFSISFGLIAVISIILAGIQYSSSGGDPQKVTQAKQRISKTIFAIVAYFFLYALLQFIVPGGIFKT